MSSSTSHHEALPREPAYRAPQVRATLADRAAAAVAVLRDCTICPRQCRVDRLANETGQCGVGRDARVDAAFPHLGEEDCVRGTRGSGTIFFGGCNLHCVFCQNHEISSGAVGASCDAGRLARLMLDLEEAGCHNINWVTPTHALPQLLEALALAADEGLSLPIVYNTSAYDDVEMLRLLDGVVDIYMPDVKFFDVESARRYLNAPDYPEVARAAVREMHRQVGDLVVDADGLAQRGLLVRHLVMPNHAQDAAAIFRFLADEISRDTAVNVMGQYRPVSAAGRTALSGIDRPTTVHELDTARSAARSAGLTRLL